MNLKYILRKYSENVIHILVTDLQTSHHLYWLELIDLVLQLYLFWDREICIVQIKDSQQFIEKSKLTFYLNKQPLYAAQSYILEC